MTTLRALIATTLLALCAATSHAQTLKSLMFNTTNGQVVANTGTNVLTFTNSFSFNGNNGAMALTLTGQEFAIYSGAPGENIVKFPIDDVPVFSTNYYWNDPSIRSAFGFSTNLTALWTATNAAAARSAVGIISTLKTTNQTNATEDLVDAMSVTLAANKAYRVTVFVVGGANNLDAAIACPTVIGSWVAYEAANGYLVPTFNVATNKTTIFAPDGVDGLSAVYEFVALAHTNTNSFTFRFATPNNDYPASIKAGSYIRAEEIP